MTNYTLYGILQKCVGISKIKQKTYFYQQFGSSVTKNNIIRCCYSRKSISGIVVVATALFLRYFFTSHFSFSVEQKKTRKRPLS